MKVPMTGGILQKRVLFQVVLEFILILEVIEITDVVCKRSITKI